jgi:hypothetical protein
MMDRRRLWLRVETHSTGNKQARLVFGVAVSRLVFGDAVLVWVFGDAVVLKVSAGAVLEPTNLSAPPGPNRPP